MKKSHPHHTKKKSPKHHASKAKIRKFSVLTEKTTKLHTHTKAARNRRKIEDLKLAALKLPDKKFYSKSDIEDFFTKNSTQISTHQIKLILNKVKALEESEIRKYQEEGLTLPNLVEKIFSTDI